MYETKWSIIRTRQQLNRSYKEVCAPIIEKCRFLLYEVRPVISLEQLGLHNCCILYKESRFKAIVRRIIKEIRLQRSQNLDCTKREDILNTTIQNQNGNIKMTVEQEDPEATVKSGFSNENLSDIMDGSEENLLMEMKFQSNENLIEDFNAEKKPVALPLDEAKTPTNEFSSAGAVSTIVNNATASVTGPIKTTKQKYNLNYIEQFINDVVTKLCDKFTKDLEIGTESSYKHKGKPSNRNLFSVRNESPFLMQQIIEFVVQEHCDVDTLRRAMYCQIQRYNTRKHGISLFNDLIQINGSFLESVQYSLLNGYLCFLESSNRQSGSILENLHLITAFQKAALITEYSKILDWVLADLKETVNENQAMSKLKCQGEKDHANIGTYVFLKKLPRARFLLNTFGILAKEFGPNELSLLINSGVIGCILALLKQIGGAEALTRNHSNETTIVFEDILMQVGLV